LVVATRCTSVDQFVATFHRFCDDSTFFVSTLAERPVGLETAFSIQLEDKTPVLRGLCEVVEAWSTPVNRFGRPGVRLAVKRLTNESLVVFKMLQTARLAAEAAGDANPIAIARTATAEAASPRAPIQPPPVPMIPRTTSTPPAGLPAITKPGVPGVPFARMPLATPPPLPRIDPKVIDAKNSDAVPIPRMDPRVSEAPSLPRYDDTGPIVTVPPDPPNPPIAVGRAPSVNAIAPAQSVTPPPPPPAPVAPAPPIVASTPVTAFARPAPKPTPSIIVEDELAVPVAPAAATRVESVPRASGPLVVAERVRTVGPRAFAPANLTASITEVEQQPYVPEPIAASDDQTNPVHVESRTPGSSFILPANPLMNLSDSSLEGFVDCALYEETGNFFRAPGYEDSLVDIDDVAAPPPMTLAPVPAIRHGAPTAPPLLSPYAFNPPPEQLFSPEQTPLPMLAPQFPPPPHRYSEPLLPNGQHYSHQEAMQPPMRPTPMPVGQVDTSAPIDSTGALLALSAPAPRNRWMVIGGAAVLSSALLLMIVLVARRGGDNAKADTVKVASKDTTTDETSDVTKPDVTKPDVVRPAIAASPDITPEASRPTPVPVDVPVIDPETAAAIDGPDTLPVVGSGPCKLTVSTTPAGSIVKIDDQIIGPSPIMFAGACKRTKVDVKHPRYALGTKWVNLAADKPAEIQVPLVRPTHALTVVTVPPGATISIGGNRAGTSPTSVKIMGFTGVTITVEKKGFKPMSQKVYSKVDNDRVMLKLVRGK